MQVPGNYLCLCGKKLGRPHAFFLLVSPFLRVYTDHIDFEYLPQDKPFNRP